MRHLKLASLATFCFLVWLTASSFRLPTAPMPLVGNRLHAQQAPVSIDLFADGSFKATGGLDLTGRYTMDIQLKGHSHVSAIRCTVVLYPSNNSGTITLKMNCQFSTNSGQWQIVSGTGEYANLKGNGSLDMIGDDEFLDGKIN